MASICLHTNWTLGGVKDRYIKYKKTGDQFVGRDLTGLPILKNSLQCPLLTFLFHHVKMISRREKHFELNNWIRERISAEAISNGEIFYLMKMCVVYFVYHADFLKISLHQSVR